MADPMEREKRAAAEAAALEARDGIAVGLGTGSTVAFFVPALAARKLSITCVATSHETEKQARDLGLEVLAFEKGPDRLDLAVDGADQVSGQRWLVKGGGGAHTREKVVAAAAERLVVIASPDKMVEAIRPPIPLELMRFGLAAILRGLEQIGPVRVRDAPPTPDGGILVDYLGGIDDPEALALVLDSVPGIVGHGLFPPSLVDEVLVGRADGGVERR